jgi:hypothetical protein
MVRDSVHGLFTTQSFTIIVSDVNEQPSMTNTSVTIAFSSLAPGLTVTTLAASDPDTAPGLQYSIVSPDSFPLFVINSNSGVVSLVNTTAAVTLAGTTVLSVRVTDAGGLWMSTTVTVTVLPMGTPQFGGVVSSTLNLPTAGGSELLMQGDNFAAGSNITARYGNDAMKTLNLTYTTSVRSVLCFSIVCWPVCQCCCCCCCCCCVVLFRQLCSVLSAVLVSCTTTPGVGLQHILSLYSNNVLMQSSVGVQYVSYIAPTITSATATTAPSTSLLATVGGDTVVIRGTNFAPSCALASAMFTAAALNLTSCNTTMIVGTTYPGSGTLGPVSVSIGGQSTTGLVVFAFSPPAISSLVSVRPEIATFSMLSTHTRRRKARCGVHRWCSHRPNES